jgi:hypothetical protein
MQSARALSVFIPILAVTTADVNDYSDKINRLKERQHNQPGRARHER